MRLDAAQARLRFAQQRVARLATVATPRPGLVPIVFAVVGEVIYTVVDDKPKTTRALHRLANIAADPAVTVLADHYDEDWSRLWWARADGTARVFEVDAPEAKDALPALAERYAAYRLPPPGPVIAINVARWSGWVGATIRSGS